MQMYGRRKLAAVALLPVVTIRLYYAFRGNAATPNRPPALTTAPVVEQDRSTNVRLTMTEAAEKKGKRYVDS